MISRLVYVCCDRCGTPASDGVVGDAKEARAIAKRQGFTRKPHPDPAMVGTIDLCPKCGEAEAA